MRRAPSKLKQGRSPEAAKRQVDQTGQVDRDFAVILVWGAAIAALLFLIATILDWIGLIDVSL